jgi:uncharacterized membrane protein YdbT with pleckstrin-like domain
VVGIFLATWIAYTKSELVLTDRRLLFRTGFLSNRSGDVPLENVESIYLSEPFLGRLVGYGTVAVTTIGGATFLLAFIGEPQQFHSKLQEWVAKAKSSSRQTSKPSGDPPPDSYSRYRPKG